MPDITPVALGIKVPDAMQTLGSVLGAANAQQAYKTSQFDLEKKRATLDSDIARNKAETSRAETSATGEAADLAEKKNLRALAKNGFQEYLGPDGQMDFNKLVPAALTAAPTKGSEFISKMYGMHTDFTNAKKALLELNEGQRGYAGQQILSMQGLSPEEVRKRLDTLKTDIPQIGPAVDSAWKNHLLPAKDDPKAFADAINRVAKGTMTIAGQNQANTPNTVGVNTGGTTSVMNTGTAPMAPGAGAASIIPGSTMTQTPAPQLVPQAGGTAAYNPTKNAIEPVAAPAAAAPPNAAPAAVPAQWNGATPLQYPVRTAGAAFAPGPSEGIDTQMGQNYRNALVTTQQQLPTIKRNNEELTTQIDKVMGNQFLTSGVVGGAIRNTKTALGDPTYKQLSKDLANAQISAIQASGGSLATDAGKALVAHANGDETYPPEVLRNIARRASADITNADMQATAAQKFAQQYGDNNMNAFKLEWNKNADSRVFEAMNLYNRAQNKASVKPQIDALFGSDPAKRKEYFQKYQNLQKLYQTGSL